MLGTLHRDGLDLELAYNNRANVSGHEEIQAGRERDAAAYRAATTCELDVSYGPDERNFYDFFPAENASGSPAPLAVFIHGGYWMRGDRRNQSHFARGLNQHGISVAMPSYRLCPTVTVMDIVADMRMLMTALWRRFGQRIFVAGHSAGGHLTSAMTATDWSQEDGDHPGDLIMGAYAVSGIYDLLPLLGLAEPKEIELTEDVARAASTIAWSLPRTDIAMGTAVGLDETVAFLDQTRGLCKAWPEKGLPVSSFEVPGTNHFTVISALAEPDSDMTKQVVDMVRATAR